MKMRVSFFIISFSNFFLCFFSERGKISSVLFSVEYSLQIEIRQVLCKIYGKVSWDLEISSHGREKIHRIKRCRELNGMDQVSLVMFIFLPNDE